MLVVLVGLCLLFVGFVYLLLRQGGRTVVRLEAIERRLDEIAAASPAEPIEQHGHGLAIGAEAPTFELPDLNGSLVSLEQFRGRTVLLTFFNPDCGFCRKMAPDLASCASASRDSEPVIVVLSMGGAERNRELFEGSRSLWPQVLLQHDLELGSRYKVGGTPMGYLITADGKIASELVVGAEALLRLVPDQRDSPTSNGHVDEGVAGTALKVYRGNRPLSESKLERNGLSAGIAAPAIRVPRVGGGELALEDYIGRRVLLVFSDPDCGPCQQLTPELDRLEQERGDLEVVVISRGDPEHNRVKFDQAAFPVGLQRRWEVSKDYGMFATPIGYLVDERGVIATDVAVGPQAILALATTSPTMSTDSTQEED